MVNQGVSVPKPQQKPPFCACRSLFDHYGAVLRAKKSSEVQLLFVGADAGRVLFHQPSENEDLENGKYNGGQQADAQNVEAHRAPDQSGNEQQSVPSDFHGWFSLCDRAAAVDAFPGRSPATAVLS